MLATLPEFLTVTVCDGAGPPSTATPNASDVGEADNAGWAGFVPEPLSATLTLAPLEAAHVE